MLQLKLHLFFYSEDRLNLKGSHDAILSFAFSLECYKLHRDTIPKFAKTKVSNPKRYSLSKLRLVHALLKWLI